MMRKGFTIIEVLVVIGIIAILATIVTTVASSSIKSREYSKTCLNKPK